MVSAYEKCVKPQEKIYRILLERYALDPTQCVFIDDYAENVQGAQAVGMNSFVFTGPEEAKKTLIQMGV